MTTYKEKRAQYIARIDEALQAYLQAEGMPELLYNGMRYSVFAGGKRLRPILALAACELLNGCVDLALPFACALEMIHTYSLIHDDLPAMDDDDLRRGRPTNHRVFGEGQAILSGDGLLSRAFELLIDTLTQTLHDPLAAQYQPRLINACGAIIKGAGVTGMVAGQCLDLLYEGSLRADEALLHKIHSGKTAALIKASVEAGALVAGAGEDTLQCLRAFADQYGLLFQITDDILDIVGEEADLGKTTGKDEKAGKLTFPAIYGLEGAKERAQAAARQAGASLECFGERAWYFHTLVDLTLTRSF